MQNSKVKNSVVKYLKYVFKIIGLILHFKLPYFDYEINITVLFVK